MRLTSYPGRLNHGDKGAAAPCLFGNGQGTAVPFLSKSKNSHIIHQIARSLDGKPVVGTDQY